MKRFQRDTMFDYSRSIRTGLLLLATLASGCQPILTTNSLEDPSNTADSAGYACHNSAGAYALPRHLLAFDVTLTEGGTGPSHYDITTPVGTPAQADPHAIYCLDFLGSAWADDKVQVKRYASGPNDPDAPQLLLSRIDTLVEDKTLEIASAVVDAAAAAIAGAGGQNRGAIGLSGTGSNRTYDYAHFEVDPFDKPWMSRINKALDPMDHCIFLDPTDDPYVPEWQGDLCKGYGISDDGAFPYYGAAAINPRLPPRSMGAKGVLYRPLLTHKLIIMKRNRDPVGPEWQLFGTQRVAMANAAPAFLLEVKRSAFVARAMSISFDHGSLFSIRLSKPSEANAFAGFVLRTVQVVVSIPVRALVIGQTDAKNRQDLIAAQAGLLQTVAAYKKAIADQSTPAAAADGKAQPQRAAMQGETDVRSGARQSLSYDACIQNSMLINPDQDPAAVCAGLVTSGGQ
jgi:hypothetical protein